MKITQSLQLSSDASTLWRSSVNITDRVERKQLRMRNDCRWRLVSFRLQLGRQLVLVWSLPDQKHLLHRLLRVPLRPHKRYDVTLTEPANSMTSLSLLVLMTSDWVGCATDEACATKCVENYMDRYGTYCTGKPDNQVIDWMQESAREATLPSDLILCLFVMSDHVRGVRRSPQWRTNRMWLQFDCRLQRQGLGLLCRTQLLT